MVMCYKITIKMYFLNADRYIYFIYYDNVQNIHKLHMGHSFVISTKEAHGKMKN